MIEYHHCMIEQITGLWKKVQRKAERISTEILFEEPWERHYEGLGNKFAELKATQSSEVYWEEFVKEIRSCIEVRRQERTIFLRKDIHDALADWESRSHTPNRSTTVSSDSSQE